MSPEILQLIASSTLDTLIMVGLSGLLGTLFGLPLGVFLATSRAGELFSAPITNRILGLIVNATRSTPFIILVVAIVPLTRLIVGTSIGTRAAVVPLTIAAIPFIGRVVEAAIREVDQGLVEAARAFGASPLQIVRKVLLPEALPALTLALTLTLVSLLGYSAMVGAVGGGGLGDLGIRYGYQRFMPEVMVAVVLVLIVLVQGVQSFGEAIARRLDKRSRN
jgi:D-methionine transport system permease protein